MYFSLFRDAGYFIPKVFEIITRLALKTSQILKESVNIFFSLSDAQTLYQLKSRLNLFEISNLILKFEDLIYSSPPT